jgi:hypothetical protein
MSALPKLRGSPLVGGEGLEELADKHVQTRPTVGLLDG